MICTKVSNARVAGLELRDGSAYEKENKGAVDRVLKQNNTLKHKLGDGTWELGTYGMACRYVCCFIIF